MKTIQIIPGMAATGTGLGAGRRGRVQEDSVAVAIQDRYFELGGNFFDTARFYGDGRSDEILGQWVRERGIRDKVILCAKGAHPPKGDRLAPRLSPEEIVRDLDESLKALGTDYADLYVLHRDWPEWPVAPMMEALHEQVKKGKTRAIGASNWTASRIQEANDYAVSNGLTPFAASQTHFSLAKTTAHAMSDITLSPMNEVEQDWYEKSQMPVLAYGVLANGFYRALEQGAELPAGAQKRYAYFPENLRRGERLVALSKQLGVSASSVAMAYARCQPFPVVALCGFSTVEQLEDVMDSAQLTLTTQQVAWLDGKSACLD